MNKVLKICLCSKTVADALTCYKEQKKATEQIYIFKE
jgi:hypothetical protein